MFHTRALIISTNTLAPGYHLFTVLAPEIAVAAKPGQFIQVNIGEMAVNDPLLPRPISLLQRNEAEGSISFIFKVLGRGTGILAGKRKGELLSVRGPIGNGFSVGGAVRSIFLVAGGIGMPPLFFLADYLAENTPQTKVTLFYGGRTRSDLLELERWSGLGVEVLAATDDGSYGYKGLITDLVSDKLKTAPPDLLAACGPQPMLRAVQGLAAEFKIPCQLSLEAHMACGVGACLGCACKTSQGHRRVCVDGPVFSSEEVVL
jgi:dihydroorotate dehydrogenase electron transfer subunit